MFGRKTRKQKKEEKRDTFQEELRKGLLFWIPGGSSRLDVYFDYCIIRCLGKTRMEEKFRKIPFTSIDKVVYTPASTARNASLQLFTKEMPNVKRSFWNPYENNMVVVHPGSEELAMQVAEYIRDPYGSNLVPPEYINQLKKERKQEIREEKEKQAQAEKEAKAEKEAAPEDAE